MKGNPLRSAVQHKEPSYSVHVQRIHSEVVRIHVEVFEDFFQGELLTTLFHDNAVRLCVVCLLYEFQQMLLVHACSSMYVRVDLRLTHNTSAGSVSFKP